MLSRLTALWAKHPWPVVAVLVGTAGLVGVAAARLRDPALKIPTAEVKRGEFVDYVQVRGEFKAGKSVTIAAPFEAGDLQIVKLIRNGAQVKKGDVVVKFDTTKLEQDLAQNRSALKAADAEIEQARAQARLKEEQDLTDLMKARYALEEAKLDASKQEILSKIDGEEAQLKVLDAQQKLLEAGEKLRSDRGAAAAEIESKKQKRDKALFEVRQGERKIALMILRAPIGGMITLERNWRSGGPFGGAAEFKEGDRGWPGAPIAELPDLSTLRVAARVDETDRGRVQVNQSVSIRVDAVPGQEFVGRVAEISALATTDFSAGWPFPRNFDVEVRLERTDARLRPGMSATARVATDRLADSILVPVEACFQKSGRTVAYVFRNSSFEEREVKIGRRGEGQLTVVAGLKPGERVALKDPTVKE